MIAANDADAAVSRIEQLARVSEGQAADEATGAWQSAQQQLSSALDAVWVRATTFAWVETRAAGARVAFSGVGYLGSVRTVAGEALGRAEMAAHAAAVDHAVETRNRYLRIGLAAARTAASLQAAYANPLFAWSAARNAAALVEELRRAAA